MAALLYMIWDYSKLELKMIPDDLTCIQVRQKYNVPHQARLKVEEAVEFNDLSFEKADFKRNTENIRKRPIVSGAWHNFCVTPAFAKNDKKEIESLATVLQSSGKCHLLQEALFGKTCGPCDKFNTSCKVNDIKDVADDSQNNSLINTDLFEKFEGCISVLPQSAFKSDFQQRPMRRKCI